MPIANVFITRECNLDCSFCFAKNAREPDDNWYAVLDSLKNIDVSTIRICGGEPLMRVDRIKEIRSIYPEKKIIINSNGTLLSKEIIEWINSNNVIIQLSIDGFDRGERRLIDLDIDLIKKIDSLWVNQILFYPEDIPKIRKEIEPSKYEVCLLRGKSDITDEYLCKIVNLTKKCFFGKIDPDDYEEITIFQTGKKYSASRNKESDHCKYLREMIGEEIWQSLRYRK